MNGEVLRGEVYWLKDRDSFGCEERLKRPVCIVSSAQGNMTSPLVIGASMTSKTKWGSINVPVRATGRQSWVMCNQVYCLDKNRLDGYIGVLSDREMAEVDRGLRIAMDLMGHKDEDEIAELEEEILSLKGEITRLKEQLSSKDAESQIKCEAYKKLYEKALDEFVSYKFAQDVDILAREKTVEVVEEESLPSPATEPEPEPELVDVNTCSYEELRSIGVDGYLADNIIKNRPYDDIEDVKFVPGMKSIAYNILKNKIRVDPWEKKVEPKAPSKLNINTATIEDFQKIGIGVQTARMICSYRKKLGLFTKVEDLLVVPRFGKMCLLKYGGMLEV
ncbi:MAG: helix-hairpin-helix domain-containing protein [Clostridia bacterium]|nr:helix-hairpin-helix domain-containing protein [Clostridia bacterium]